MGFNSGFKGLKLALASFMTDSHSVCQNSCSPSLYTHVLRSHSTSIHVNLGLCLYLLLVGLPRTSLLSFYHLFSHHAQGIPNLYCNYSYNTRRFKFIEHFLIYIYSPVTISVCWLKYYSQNFRFPHNDSES